MGDVSRHFNRSEFSCSDSCGFEAVDIKLIKVLEKVREKFGPVIIHCACRCKAKNDSVNSKDTSQHLRGLAADFHIVDTDNNEIAYYIDSILPDSGGIGIYSWGIHADVRRERKRWDNTK